jgi:hypothetical protein
MAVKSIAQDETTVADIGFPTAAMSELTAEREAAFFSAIRLSNGTFKTTSDRRMDDLNTFVVDEWRRSGVRVDEALDLGASSGVSTLEWLDALTNAGHDVHMTATDLALWVNVIRLGPGFSVLEDASGLPLQHIFFGLRLRPWRRKLDYVTGYALLGRIIRVAAALLRAKSTARSSRVMLASPRALDHDRLSWAEDNVLAPNRERFVHRFDVIRAANILNLGYFEPEQIRIAVRNLKRRLKGPGAHLIVNRTWSDGTNHATLFRLGAADRFEVQARFGRGSEIDELVLSDGA